MWERPELLLDGLPKIDFLNRVKPTWTSRGVLKCKGNVELPLIGTCHIKSPDYSHNSPTAGGEPIEGGHLQLPTGRAADTRQWGQRERLNGCDAGSSVDICSFAHSRRLKVWRIPPGPIEHGVRDDPQRVHLTESPPLPLVPVCTTPDGKCPRPDLPIR